jgi:hypothetical protein
MQIDRFLEVCAIKSFGNGLDGLTDVVVDVFSGSGAAISWKFGQRPEL